MQICNRDSRKAFEIKVAYEICAINFFFESLFSSSCVQRGEAEIERLEGFEWSNTDSDLGTVSLLVVV